MAFGHKGTSKGADFVNGETRRTKCRTYWQQDKSSRVGSETLSIAIKHLRTRTNIPTQTHTERFAQPHCTNGPPHKPISRQFTRLSICRPDRNSISGRPAAPRRRLEMGDVEGIHKPFVNGSISPYAEQSND
jgi:hypothetical protein